MPKKSDDEYSDAEFAAALRAGGPIGAQRRTPVWRGSVQVGVPIYRLTKLLRGHGRMKEPEPELVTELSKHNLIVYQDAKDGKWKLPKKGESPIRWTDSQYAQALNSLEVGTPLGRRHVTGKGVRDGVEVDVPVGTFVSRLLDTSSTDRVH
ncbi:hypothetical protein RB197_00010, partial [Streptomyces umbrinus]